MLGRSEFPWNCTPSAFRNCHFDILIRGPVNQFLESNNFILKRLVAYMAFIFSS